MKNFKEMKDKFMQIMIEDYLSEISYEIKNFDTVELSRRVLEVSDAIDAEEEVALGELNLDLQYAEKSDEK